MKQQISVGLIGFGTVGTGTFRILRDNAELIQSRLGVPVKVKKIAVRDINRSREIQVSAALLTDNPDEVVNDPEIDVVVELIGGYEPAKRLILGAIAHGKHIVTANKALLSAHGSEIFSAARRKSAAVGFEASVGGGIPVIKVLKEALAANRILSVYGILNGTCNYILTKMTDEGRSFDDVLAEAQRDQQCDPDAVWLPYCSGAGSRAGALESFRGSADSTCR